MSIRVLILIATTSVVLSADCFCQEESKEPFGELRIGVSPVTIVTQDLVPGAKNRVEVRLKNKTGQNLTIEEVHVSCGCIVVGELKKHLGMDEEVTVPIDLRSKLRSGRFENSITLVDSEKREWQLVLASKVIAPIISDTLQFELPLPGEPGELRKDSVVSCYCTYTDVCDYDCVIDPIGGTKRCKSMNRTDTAITKLITVVGTCVGGIEEP